MIIHKTPCDMLLSDAAPRSSILHGATADVPYPQSNIPIFNPPSPARYWPTHDPNSTPPSTNAQTLHHNGFRMKAKRISRLHRTAALHRYLRLPPSTRTHPWNRHDASIGSIARGPRGGAAVDGWTLVGEEAGWAEHYVEVWLLAGGY